MKAEDLDNETLIRYTDLAIAYVDKHKYEPGWVTKMIAYYTDPEHPCRRHAYTEMVLEYLYMVEPLVSEDK